MAEALNKFTTIIEKEQAAFSARLACHRPPFGVVVVWLPSWLAFGQAVETAETACPESKLAGCWSQYQLLYLWSSLFNDKTVASELWSSSAASALLPRLQCCSGTLRAVELCNSFASAVAAFLVSAEKQLESCRALEQLR